MTLSRRDLLERAQQEQRRETLQRLSEGSVTTRVQGILEKIHVKETWVPVEEGQVLGGIYSDALYGAQTQRAPAFRGPGLLCVDGLR